MLKCIQLWGSSICFVLMLSQTIRVKRLRLKVVLFFTILSSTSLSGQCQYTLTLLDSYGDGWNGNSMTVFVTDKCLLSNQCWPH